MTPVAPGPSGPIGRAVPEHVLKKVLQEFNRDTANALAVSVNLAKPSKLNHAI